MFYQLPPVGDPVCLSTSDQPDALLQTFGDNYQPRYFASGTAALAAAITAATRIKPVEKPEVILPAYGCPDLISAAVFAGVKPVLVDLEVDRPWMNLEQVAEKISSQTVAIIAVNLFGIPERMDPLRLLAKQSEALLIEDSAQAFPGKSEQEFWQGDLVVLSFGRGKPVSLLGGGAVLCRQNKSQQPLWNDLLSVGANKSDEGISQRILFNLKARLYNWMIKPRLYWLLQALPFLHLGETHYHPLASIDEMSLVNSSLLTANVKIYRDDPVTAQKQLSAILSELNLKESGIIDLPESCGFTKHQRLLRYPLLVKSGTRDQLYEELHHSGLGPSRMYPTVLPEIPGLGQLLSGQGMFPVAASFTERLLTLPTHRQVTQADIAKIQQILSRCL